MQKHTSAGLTAVLGDKGRFFGFSCITVYFEEFHPPCKKGCVNLQATNDKQSSNFLQAEKFHGKKRHKNCLCMHYA